MEEAELGFDTSNDCFSSNDAFLLSLAWCLYDHCETAERGHNDARNSHHIMEWQLERFWLQDVVEHPAEPKYSYRQALQLCGKSGPAQVVSKGALLDAPSNLTMEDWLEVENNLADFAAVETKHSAYGIGLLATSICLPLVLALTGSMLFSISKRFHRLLASYLVDPALLSKRYFVRLPFEIGVMPNRGQMALILCILLLNIFFCLIGYGNCQEELTSYIANRTGVLSFANLPVIALYSGRNNPLIKFTGWTLATFLLFHRWVAYICILQAFVHSVLYFVMHLHVLIHKFTQAYWNIGVVATIALCLIFPASLLFVRRRWYQLFLDLHILLAFITFITCYYHIIAKFGHKWGYENWVILAIIFWLTERLVRGFKILSNGYCTATVGNIDEDYIRIQVQGVQAIGEAYLYFPTLGWRVWENHPFSIAASTLDHTQATLDSYEDVDLDFNIQLEDSSESGSYMMKDYGPIDQHESDEPHTIHQHRSGEGDEDVRELLLENSEQGSVLNGHPSRSDLSPQPNKKDSKSMKSGSGGNNTVSGLTFLIRREKGLTELLAKMVENKAVAIPVLVESCYTSHSFSSLALTSSHVVCIAGGAGISAILPILRLRMAPDLGRTALYFGTRSSALLRASGVDTMRDSGIDLNVQIGTRWDIPWIIQHEMGFEAEFAVFNRRKLCQEIVVIVCGPGSMSDDVREAVVKANSSLARGHVIRFIDERFNW